MIDFFIGRMTVLGRGLVFQPVLVTQTCTYNSKNITLTLQIIHQKEKKRKKKEKIFFKKNITIIIIIIMSVFLERFSM